LLTPVKYVPKEWFPPLRGSKVLGLASGGGQQMPVFAALGAHCTILDYSDKQLASEKFVSERENYSIQIIKADMTKKLPFDDGAFDMLFHPVSNCYVEDINPIWKECFRVLKKGGVLLAGFDNGLNYLFDDDSTWPLVVANKLPFNPLKAPGLYEKLKKSDDGIQFSHTLEEQIGGQLQAGFVLTDLYEDQARIGLLREYAPQYMATRAVKP
jgi:ubiquinone/menaquinone biosynthesis C-methylase UbiE